jgi:hypothetical protein
MFNDRPRLEGKEAEMGKSVKVGRTRIGVTKQARPDGRGSRTSVWTYRGKR